MEHHQPSHNISKLATRPTLLRLLLKHVLHTSPINKCQNCLLFITANETALSAELHDVTYTELLTILSDRAVWEWMGQSLKQELRHQLTQETARADSAEYDLAMEQLKTVPTVETEQ